MTYELSSHDREILRELAMQFAEFTQRPEEEEKERLWRCHNALQPERPMLVCDIEPPMWAEIMPRHELRCEASWAREHEDALCKKLFQCRNLVDDWVFLPMHYVPVAIEFGSWGLDVHTTESGQDRGAVHFDPVIVESRDIEKIQAPSVAIDWVKTNARKTALEDAFGDALEIRPKGYDTPWFSPVDLFIQWRGLSQMYLDMMDDPNWLHEALERTTTAYLAMLDQVVEQGGLTSNHDSHFVGSGGQGFVDELPQPDFDGKHLRTIDMWGQATAQAFSEVSPAMHEEFSLPYDKRWLERFGLGCYGCCEPLHAKIDVLRQIPNLRRISMSPWVNVELGARNIGNDYIFSSKPNPALLAAETWNPNQARSAMRDVLDKTKDCTVEFIMKDTQTCRNEAQRVIEWVQLAREEILDSMS